MPLLAPCSMQHALHCPSASYGSYFELTHPPPAVPSSPPSAAPSLAQIVLNDVAMSRVLSHPNLLSSLGHEVLDCPEALDQVEVRTYYPLKDMDALDYLHKHGALKQEVGWPWLEQGRL